ncbi:MAG: RNA polymerase subunit sigma, partial [Deltaproteobacteria bacterium]|nr:RNA polymerase subunit sigma [Deltaproteobacteria bacterium]
MSPLKADIEGAARILVGAGTTIALTGAGISVPSGIPDFRSESGLWSRFDIHEYGTLDAFRANPRKVWRLFHEIAATMDGAEPNPAHEALVRLEQMGLLAATVTQNIDNLHRKAGARNLIEFHGSAETLSCLKCGSSWPRAEAEGMLDEARIPVCRCGTVLKPDIILFGESIPVHALRDSFELASRADAILVVGTSAEVA